MNVVNYIFYLLLMLATFSVLMSCGAREGCTDPSSENFDIDAEVDNGTCIPMTLKFEGNYEIEEECPLDDYFYNMGINASFNDPFEIILSNFGDFNINVSAFVDGFFFEIPDQFFIVNGDVINIMNGIGELNGNQIIITYVYGEDDVPIEVCELYCYRF